MIINDIGCSKWGECPLKSQGKMLKNASLLSWCMLGLGPLTTTLNLVHIHSPRICQSIQVPHRCWSLCCPRMQHSCIFGIRSILAYSEISQSRTRWKEKMHWIWQFPKEIPNGLVENTVECSMIFPENPGLPGWNSASWNAVFDMVRWRQCLAYPGNLTIGSISHMATEQEMSAKAGDW